MNNYDRMHRGDIKPKIPENKAKIAVDAKRKKIVKIVFAVVLVVSLILLIGLFDVYGQAYSTALYGAFGCCSVAGLIVIIALSILKLIGATPRKVSARTIFYMVALCLLVALFLQVISTVKDFNALTDKSYKSYLDSCFFNGRNNAGGVMLGVIAYPFLRYLDSVFSLCIIAVMFFGLLLLCFRSFFYVEKVQTVVSEETGNSGMYIETIEGDKKTKKKKGEVSVDLSFPNDISPEEEPEEEPEDAEIEYTAGTISDKLLSQILDNQDKEARVKKAEELLFMPEDELKKRIQKQQEETEAKDSALKTGERKPYQTGFGGDEATKKLSVEEAYKNYASGGLSAKDLLFGNVIESHDYSYDELYPKNNASKDYDDLNGLLYTGKETKVTSEPKKEETVEQTVNQNIEQAEPKYFNPSTPIAELTDVSKAIYDESIDLNNADVDEEDPSPYVEQKMIKPDEVLEERESPFKTIYREPVILEEEVEEQQEQISETLTTEAKPEVKPEVKPVPKKVIRPYTCPSLALLGEPEIKPSTIDYVSVYKQIEDAFKSYEIDCRVISHTRGPTFTLYAVQLGEGVPYKKVTSREDDINRKMHCDEPIHIVPSVKNTDAIGIEVFYRNEKMPVPLKRYLCSTKFKEPDKLYFPIGVDVYGDAYYCNILGAPHLLIGGTTGSGKSVCINAILTTIMYNYSPEFVKVILVDPKAVELTSFATIPHNLLGKSITDAPDCIKALSWAVDEMNRRYDIMARAQRKSLAPYNEYLRSKGEKPLPYIVIVIDEVADLMLSNKKTAPELERLINVLTAKARAAGIHLIIATQRPSTEIITGLIKNNISTRIAFTMGDAVASKVILDKGGAEKLYGKGDLLFSSPEYNNPLRLQGMFISDDEVNNVTDYVKLNNDFEPDQKAYDEIFNPKPIVQDVMIQPTRAVSQASEQREADFKKIYNEVLTYAVRAGTISISKVERQFRIGFRKAGIIVDKMFAEGIIEAEKQGSSKGRSVLISEADLPNYLLDENGDDQE